MSKISITLLCLLNLNLFTFSLAQSKILVITGGHGFEEKEFYEMFDSFRGIEYDTVTHPKANQLLEDSDIKKYSCLVFYDMVQDISENQKKAMIELLDEGMGMVFLHHSLVSYQNWPEFENIIGGKYHLDPSETQTTSTYRHDVDITVKIANTREGHPLTKGMNDFIIHDEVYGNYSVNENVNALIITDHPESTPTIGWWHQYRNSRIVYVQLGHDHWAYANENYRLLVQRAIHFVSQDQ
jgi:type 1 glutamine amidotransferase